MGGAIIKIDDGQKKKIMYTRDKTYIYVKKEDKKKYKKIKQNRTYRNKMYGNTIHCFHYKCKRFLNSMYLFGKEQVNAGVMIFVEGRSNSNERAHAHLLML